MTSGGRRVQLLVLVGIALIALTLRSAVTAVSPLIEDLREDLGVGTAAIGILGLLPPLCFAVVGALAPAVGRKLGLERALVLSLAVTVAGTLGRSVVDGVVPFLVLSAVTLSGMAMGNVLLPPAVKRYFPGHIGTVTSFYVVMIAVGAALPPYVAVPLGDAFGWRLSLASWALVAVAAVLPWLPRLRTRGGGEFIHPGSRVAVLRSRRAWGLTLMFGMTALNVYSLFAWLPSILIDAGFSVGDAGTLLGLYAGTGIPASIVVPLIAARMTNPFPLMLVFGAFFAVGYYGLLVTPTSQPVLWMIMAGLGPSTFPLSITMINLRTTTEAGSASLSGMVQGIGYAVAGVGPPVFGLLHEATGSWNPPLALLSCTVVLIMVGAWFACQPGTVEQELAERAAARGDGVTPVLTGHRP
ncbi:MAG: MFS transporter [Geodermatophilaceae bacterium]|nr:MFS transporter [Geodermatophilaceae bacterium]